jgi:subtilisin family serine protease
MYRFPCTLIMAAMLSFICASAGAKNGNPYVPGQMVVKMKAGFEDRLDSIARFYNSTVADSVSILKGYLLDVPPQLDCESLALEIEVEPDVEYCGANYILAVPEPVQSSQPFIDLQARGDFQNQPAATKLALPSARAINPGEGVRVGVIDGGANLTHPALAGAVTSAYDFVAGDSLAVDEPGGSASGHGTFIAGVIRLVAPQAEIRAYRVLDTAGNGDGFSIAEAIVRAVDDSCKVINLSMVMTGRHATIDQALSYAQLHNATVVVAAGNDSADIQVFPASDSHVLSVAALDSVDRKADFSNYGSGISLSAPGTSIYAPYLDSAYAWWNGTSFAAPFVAGTAALVYAADPSATPQTIRDALRNTATNVDPLNPAYAGKLGAGLINPTAALESVVSNTCGDLNQDFIGPDLSDLVFLVDYLLMGGPPPRNLAVTHLDVGAGLPDIADLSYLVDFLFFGGPAPLCTP